MSLRHADKILVVAPGANALQSFKNIRMKEIRKILAITIHYPSRAAPTKAVFVRSIIESLARQGVHCVVVQPISVWQSLNRRGYPFHEFRMIGNAGQVEVFRPAYGCWPIVSWGVRLGKLNPNKLKFRLFRRSVSRLVRRIRFVPDVVYGHFLYFAGGCAVDVAGELHLPSFIGVGEGEFWSVRPFGTDYAKKHLRGATALIANATHLAKKLTLDLEIPADRVHVLPNGVDLSVFRPYEQKEARRRLGLPQDRFIVGAVGNFLHKKGIARVGQAINGLDGVGGVFAGSGPEPPSGKNVLWARPVPHEQLPWMLSACDVFVLPTLVEGCCNALIEAMACGLPIISSDSEYTQDLLSSECSIGVVPLDVVAIRNAVLKVRADRDLRQRMAAAALRQAQRFDINTRASCLRAVMGEMTGE